MGKLPYMQFYPADWLQDTLPLSLAAKGAWINILCALWSAQNRGTHTLPLVGWARQIGASVEQTKAVISELVDMSVCDCPSHQNVSSVTEHNEKITLVCRRMAREEKARESNASRQKKFRNKSVTPPSNAPITPYLQKLSSDSLSKPPSHQGGGETLNGGDPPNDSEERDASLLSLDVSTSGGIDGQPECYSLEFLELWECYPRQECQDDAWIAWKELTGKRLNPGLAKLQDSVLRHKDSRQWQQDDGRFIPLLAAFLRKGMWRDSPKPNQQATKKGRTPAWL